SDVLGLLARRAQIRLTELAASIYSPRNCDAARHLYRVTAGLDSMIVGEAEIQGQVKRSYEAAIAGETVGPLTNHLFKAALATGKRVQTVFVASRRRDRAISLARRYGGVSVMFDELPGALEQADMLVAATASPHL